MTATTSHLHRPLLSSPPRHGPALALALVAVLACPPAAPAQQVPVARQSLGGIDIWVAAEDGSAATRVVDDVAFRPLRLAGAVARERLRLDRPRPGDLEAPVDHIRLPQGGSLYAVRGAASDALLQVRADGWVRTAVEVPLAPGGAGLLGEVAVSADGRHALAATAATAGGDVLLLDLDAATPATDLSAALPPLDVAPGSLRVSADRAWFVAGDVLHRADLVTATALPVDLGLPPGSLPLPELVLSGDGLCAAVVAEHTDGTRDVVVVDAAGLATTVTEAPGDVDPPGLDQATGPFLALSHDGGLLALRRTVLFKDELFVRRTDLAMPEQQLTADANFTDTIDGIGVIGFVDLDVLVFAAGEFQLKAGVPSVDSADIYRAAVPAAGPATLQNLTQTSGLASPPFLEAGDIDVFESLDDPLGERTLFLFDPDNGDFGVLAVSHDGATGFTTLLPGVDVEPSLSALGDRVLIRSQDGPGAATDLTLVHPLGAAPGSQFLGSVPADIVVDRFACHEATDMAGLVLSATPDFELPVFLHLPTGAAAAAWPVTFGVSPALAFSPSGYLVGGAGLGGGPFLFAAFPVPGAGVVLPVPVGNGFPLAR